MAAENGENADTVELLPSRKLSVSKQPGITRHIIKLEGAGPISVYLQGDLEKGREGPVMMTIHGVGSSYQSMVEFVSHEDMAEVKQRCMFLHVSIYGQGSEAEDLTAPFPALETIGMGLVTVLDELRIKNVVVLGEGAGANVALSFGLCHPTRTEGLVLTNCSGSEGSPSLMDKMMEKLVGVSVTEEESHLNKSNVLKYDEAFKTRKSLLDKINARINYKVLLMTGAKSKLLDETNEVYTRIQAGKAEFIKVDDVSDPLREAADKVIDAVILFTQGLGLMPCVKRKYSRNISMSEDDKAALAAASRNMTRRVSMEQADIPNLRRFSLTQQ